MSADEYDFPALIRECPDCAEHLFADGLGLVDAFASVGLEHGKSVREMAEDYFATYHRRGHKLGEEQP